MEALTGAKAPTTMHGINQLLEEAIPKIFVNQFPIYDESQRKPLEMLILTQYLTREICMTPVSRWIIAFNQKLALIMPKYNAMWEAMKNVNPFDDVNYSRENDRERTLQMQKGTTDKTTYTDTTDSSSTYSPGITTINTDSTTPQTQIDDFLANKYLSSASKQTQSGSDTTDGMQSRDGNSSLTRSGADTDTENENVGETIKGKQGGKSFMEMSKEYVENALTVNMAIVAEMEELFFSIY